MKLLISSLLLSTACVSSFSFAPAVSSRAAFGSALKSSVESPVSSDVAAAYESQIAKMRAKDQTSKALSKEDLKVVFEDEHIVVVDKPAGVLCVPTKEVSASLSQSVFEAFGCESGNVDSMVVHRLGMDTSDSSSLRVRRPPYRDSTPRSVHARSPANTKRWSAAPSRVTRERWTCRSCGIS